MTEKVSIGIQGQFDSSQIEQRLNSLGQKIAQANKMQFAPVSAKTVDDVNKLVQRFEQLRKIQGDLNKRISSTGQSGAGFLDVDWAKLYPDQNSRARQMRKAFEYVAGPAFSGGGMPPPGGRPPPAPPSAPPGGGGGGGGGGIGTGIVQSGLRAIGPAGGVAAGALGTGMSSGFGAGLMGLLGGLGALAIGKVVGSAMEHVGKAEDNSVALDRLKRTLGDVNVSFDGLKAVVKAGADNLRITYDEAGRLSTQFAKIGNVSSGQYKSLAEELQTGVGLSRAFGLDPSEGVGAMGQARGMRYTSDAQESKRFALLIGETIARSGAFAKADEVMEAIGSYITSQSRASLGRPNVGGFAGMLSAMVGSGIPGLDPAGAASLMGRVNAALTSGGAKGEASQFFTAMVGNRMGMDPLQTQVLREGGAFATGDEAFGPGSVAGRYGMKGPGGSQTFLAASLAQLRRQYGSNKGLLAQATANHLGVSMRQAMAILSISPNEMGGMGKYADVTKLNAGGIASLGKTLYGSASDRSGVAQSLLGRSDVSADEKRRIEAAMASGNESTQKEVLAQIIAQRDQERTQGSDIRDSKNALDNIKTAIADKLVPIALEMRHGIMAIAGVGKGKTSEDILKSVIDADSEGRTRAINGKFASRSNPLLDRQQELENRLRPGEAAVRWTYRDKPEVLEQKLKERTEMQEELTRIEKQLKDIEAEKAQQLKKENERRAKELADVDKAALARAGGDDALTTGSIGGTGGGRADGRGSGAGRSAGFKGASIDTAMKYFMGQGWTREQAAGIVANLSSESAMDPTAVGDNGQAYGIAQWHPDRQRDFERWAGKSIKQATLAEQLAFVQYELTQGKEQGAGNALRGATTARQAGAIVSNRYERPKFKIGEAISRGGLAERIHSNSQGSVTPYNAGAGRGSPDAYDVRVSADPIVVEHRGANGMPVGPSQTLQTRVSRPNAFGGPN